VRRVLDGSGGGPSATVTTDARGQYVFSNVPSGTYHVTVALVGFATATRSDVTVSNGNVDVPAITLQIAALSDTVVVSATRSDAALIDAPATMAVIPQSTIETPRRRTTAT